MENLKISLKGSHVCWLAAHHTADPGSVHKLTTSCEHFHRIPPHAEAGSRHYLMVTLGSWVTPQLITALVPLMTLWSCGGFVMRVRAANTHRAVVTQRLCLNSGFGESLLDSVSSFSQCLSGTAWIICYFCCVEYFRGLLLWIHALRNKHAHESLD